MQFDKRRQRAWCCDPGVHPLDEEALMPALPDGVEPYSAWEVHGFCFAIAPDGTQVCKVGWVQATIGCEVVP